jgi:hypothetical protein
MKINNQYTGQALFEQLEVGDVFIYSQEQGVYIKIVDVTDSVDDYNNAVNLKNGVLCAISDDDLVLRVSAELTIY